MWRLSARDLQWRTRRFVVGVIGSAVVFALTLLLAGISAGFGNEASRSVAALHADAWVVPAGDHGPFMSSATMAASLADDISRVPGVRQAEPVTILRASMTGSRTLDINLIGVRPGAFTHPPTVEGRPPSTNGEATVERSTGVPVGSKIEIGGRAFRVVGHTAGLRYRAAVPTSYVTLSDAQTIGYTGRQLASTVVTQGTPNGPALPAGLIQLTGRQVRHDLLDPLRNPRKTIAFVEVLLWVVAAMIVGSILYVSTLDRARDFAVLKAVGASSRSLFVGLAAQALVLCTVAYAVAAGLSRVIGGASPMPSEIPSSAYLLLAVVAVVVAFVASAGGLRRTTRIDPALAFGAV